MHAVEFGDRRHDVSQAGLLNFAFPSSFHPIRSIPSHPIPSIPHACYQCIIGPCNPVFEYFSVAMALHLTCPIIH